MAACWRSAPRIIRNNRSSAENATIAADASGGASPDPNGVGNGVGIVVDGEWLSREWLRKAWSKAVCSGLTTAFLRSVESHAGPQHARGADAGDGGRRQQLVERHGVGGLSGGSTSFQLFDASLREFRDRIGRGHRVSPASHLRWR